MGTGMSQSGILGFTRAYPNEPKEEYTSCEQYDIVPTTAFIQGVPVYSLAASWGMRYIFTGGEDGFVRKYDFQASLNGGQLLTVSQRHMLPDSITKAGILSAYWENEQPLKADQYVVAQDKTYMPQISPVYSLVAQPEALWVCAGLESGGISFQSASYGELGQCIAYFSGHTKAVSDLQLSSDQNSMLSGSWDRSVAVWDMQQGIKVTSHTNLVSQVSAVDWQPMYSPIEYKEEASQKDLDLDDDKSMESLFGSDDEDTGQDQQDSAKNSEENQSEVKSEVGAEPPAAEGDAKTGNVFLSSTFNGLIELWDTRQPERAACLSATQSPPWCMSACFSTDGSEVYAGRRNACVEGYDLRNCGSVLRTLKFPAISGAVSCVARMPNNRSLLCASLDNIRVYDLKSQKKTPFTIIAGHHGSVISRIIVDKSAKYMVSSCGGRGWAENSSDMTLAYEIEPERKET